MATRTSTDRNLSCLFSLMAAAGVLLVVAGGLLVYPFVRDAILPPPSSFGAELSASDETGGLLPMASPSITDTSAKVPTRIVIPAIDLDAPIESVGWGLVEGVNTWDIPDHFAAGWLKTTALLGQRGNTVLDGHHNMAGEVFRYLVDLEPGDRIEVYAGRQIFSYEVVARHILPDRDQPIEVRRRNAGWVAPSTDERLTLVTCWPYTSNSHRLIVVAKPITSKADTFNP